jgi:hypothetical protein
LDEFRIFNIVSRGENIVKPYIVYTATNYKYNHQENCTSQDKKDAYPPYLDLKITATPEVVDIKCYLKPDLIEANSCLLTTGQTSA